ncbi:hypothetical protein [Maricaulis maris]|uniref:hypothetical protein n=1 Tax=Maricaulis maris TaxID=74318 RepID=UPI003BAB6459
MGRTILIYAAALAATVFLLEWLQYRFWARELGIEMLVGLVGLGCVGFGIWVGALVSLVSAALLRNRNLLPHRA